MSTKLEKLRTNAIARAIIKKADAQYKRLGCMGYPDYALLVFDETQKRALTCRRCKKLRGDHTAGDQMCPIGQKHRVLGYCQFHSKDRFQPML